MKSKERWRNRVETKGDMKTPFSEGLCSEKDRGVEGTAGGL